MTLKKFFIFLLLLGNVASSIAQTVTCKVLYSASANQSLYDVQVMDSNSLEAAGKNGTFIIIEKLNDSFVVNESIMLDETVYHILPTNNYDLMLCNKSSIQAFAEHQIYSNTIDCKRNQAIYCGAYQNDSCFIGSLHTKIAAGSKVIPHGRIFITNQQAKVLHTKKYWASAIWDIYKNHQHVESLKYNLFGTRILQWNGKHWQKKKHYPYLLHKAFATDSTIIYCGSKNFRRQFGVVLINNKVYKIPQTDVVWDVAMVGNTIIACGSKGKLLYKNNSTDEFKTLDTKTNFNMYDIVKVDSYTAIVVGQNGVVVEVRVN